MNVRTVGSKMAVTLMPGEYYVSRNDVVVGTILGSCVSACLYDPVNCVVGMNHFLLSGRQTNTGDTIWLSEAGRYGIHSMEIIINGMLKLGADKTNMRAKAFGGASILPVRNRGDNFASVGEINSRFVIEFLKNEGIRLVSSDLGGYEGRAIRFHSNDFYVYQRKIKRVVMPDLATREERYWQRETERSYPEPELWNTRPDKK
jgi:chemotaxis protein CheD